MRRSTVPLLALSLMVACGDDSRGDGTDSASSTSSGGESSGSGTTTGDGTSSGGEASSGGETGTGTTSTGGATTGPDTGGLEMAFCGQEPPPGAVLAPPPPTYATRSMVADEAGDDAFGRSDEEE